MTFLRSIADSGRNRRDSNDISVSGGSINGYNRAIYQQIIAEMTRRGFTYYDWNISASDTADHATAKSIQASILNAMGRYNCSVILMHDGNRETLRALDSVITGIEETGYSFGLLTNEIRPVMFSYTRLTLLMSY
jgi:hypothetical protein